MTNSKFLQNYQMLQYGIMYQRLIDLGFASIAWCEKYTSPFFNHAQVSSTITNDKLAQIENELANLDRKPAVYFENRKSLNGLKNTLAINGYKKLFEDSWMFHSGKNLDNNRYEQVKKVDNKNDLDVFLATFDNCYKKDDPQNPYGELGDYLEVARRSWCQHHDTGKIEYFTVFSSDNNPVAVSTLTNFAGIGYISNVGSLTTVRGEGFGKLASLYCVYRSVQNGNSEHVLATEEGYYPNEFYKRIGFETKFTAVGYIKETSK